MLIKLTIDCSLLAYSLLLAYQLLQPSPVKALPAWLRIVSATGCLLCVIHIGMTMHYVHHWSHQDALEHTARQTEELVGWRFGGGVYFNYLFVTLWLVDVIWCWSGPESHARRSPRITVGFHLYMLFIAINGAIVFATGPIRWISLGVCSVLAGLLVWRSRQPQPPTPARSAERGDPG